MPDALTLSLWIATAAAVVGALVGAWTLTQPETSLARAGLRSGDPRTVGLSAGRAVGGAALAAHALTAALLLQAPKIGACLAAALAAAWFGAAAGRTVSALRDGAGPVPYAALALELVMSAALAAPLWLYARLLRAHSGF